MNLKALKRFAFVYETLVFYGILHAINIGIYPESPAYIEFSPHPYWVGIIMFAFRYGFVAANLSSLLAAALYLFDTWHRGERFLLEDMEFFIQPVCFILAGMAIGFGVHTFRHKIKANEGDIEILKLNLDTIEADLKTQKLINRELEKRIVTKMSTLVTLYEGARKLESINLDDMYMSILEFFAKTLDVQQSAIYIKNGDRWDLQHHHGWSETHHWPTHYGLNDGLVGLAGQGRIVSIKDFLGQNFINSATGGLELQDNDRFMLKKECLIAGPIKKGDTQEVVAVYTIQALPLLNLNSATVNLLSFLLSWASRSVGRASYLQELKSNEILDPEYGVYSYRHFYNRLHQEFIRSSTYYLPLSVVLFELPTLEERRAHEQHAILFALCQILKEISRDMDLIGRYNEIDTPFACLLTTSSESQAQEFIGRFRENWNLLSISKTMNLRLGLSSYSPKTKTIEDLLQQAKQNLEDHAA